MNDLQKAKVRVVYESYPWLANYVNIHCVHDVDVLRVNQELVDSRPRFYDGVLRNSFGKIYLTDEKGIFLAEVGYYPPPPAEPDFRWWKVWKWRYRQGQYLPFSEKVRDTLVRLGSESKRVRFILTLSAAHLTVSVCPKKDWATELQQRANQQLEETQIATKKEITSAEKTEV